MIAKSHTTVQQAMKHYIKTAAELSPGYIQFGPTEMQKIRNRVILILTGLIGGVGQGIGGSPIMWMTVLLIIM